MPVVEYSRLFAARTWVSVMAALTFFKAGSVARAQNDPAIGAQSNPAPAGTPNNPAANTQGHSTVDTTPDKSWDLRLGPFDFHPRIAGGMTYDDNILLSAKNTEADEEWLIQPGLQAIAGDDAALIAYRDQNYDVLGLSPGGLIIQQTEVWPGKLFLLDYAPRFQFFEKYTANNSIDEFATLNLLWPMNRLILGFKQVYSHQKTEIIEFDQRAAVEMISSALSAAYQFDDTSSIESDFRRVSTAYFQPGLIGYTEYNTEEWFNHEVREDLHASLGVLAGVDDVANHQGQTFQQLRARARYSYTEKLAFDVSVGGELREYENGKSDTLIPVFSISGEFRPAERTILRLTGLREQYASIFNGYNYTSTGVMLALQQGITDRYKFDFNAGYYDLDFTPINSASREYTSDYYAIRIGIEARIIHHLTGQIFGQFLNSQSQINSAVTDIQSGVQLTLSY